MGYTEVVGPVSLLITLALHYRIILPLPAVMLLYFEHRFSLRWGRQLPPGPPLITLDLDLYKYKINIIIIAEVVLILS